MNKNLHRRKSQRINKRIYANIENRDLILANISEGGGFILSDSFRPENPFTAVIKPNMYDRIRIMCNPVWANGSGLGFSISEIPKKDEKYDAYVRKQLEFVKQFGEERVFRTEIPITLGYTNVFGNVYFAKYFEFQGIVRERFLLEHVPKINEIAASSGTSMATIEAYHSFKQSAYFGETIIGELKICNMNRTYATVVISFYNTDNSLLGTGYQKFCFLNKERKPICFPPFLDFLDFYNEA